MATKILTVGCTADYDPHCAGHYYAKVIEDVLNSIPLIVDIDDVFKHIISSSSLLNKELTIASILNPGRDYREVVNTPKTASEGILAIKKIDQRELQMDEDMSPLERIKESFIEWIGSLSLVAAYETWLEIKRVHHLEIRFLDESVQEHCNSVVEKITHIIKGEVANG